MFLQLLAPFWSKSVSFEDAVPLSMAPVGVQHPLSRAVTSLRNTLVKFWLDMCCYVPVCSGKVWHCGFLRKKRISVEKETYFLLKDGVMKKTAGHSKRWGWKCCVWQGLCPAPWARAVLGLCAPSTQVTALPFCGMLFPLSKFQDVWQKKRKGLLVSFPLCRGRNKARKSYICRKEMAECNVRFRSPETGFSAALLHSIAIYDDPFLEIHGELKQ